MEMPNQSQNIESAAEIISSMQINETVDLILDQSYSEKLWLKIVTLANQKNPSDTCYVVERVGHCRIKISRVEHQLGFKLRKTYREF